MYAADVVVIYGEDQGMGQSLLDAYRRVRLVRRAQVGGEFVDARWIAVEREPAERVCLARRADDDLTLADAVIPQRRAEWAFFKLLVEDSRAAPHNSVLAFERRPRETQTRREVVAIFQVSLRFVTQTRRQSKTRRQTNLVLSIRRVLPEAEVNAGFAGAEGVI